MTLKVGRDLVQGRKVAYKDAYSSVNEWVSAKKFLPVDYELVMIRISTGDLTYGWTIGEKWQGVLLTPKINVIAWKKKLPAELMS